MPATAPRPFRLLRSALFVPATQEAFFAKAAAGEADGIVIDLQDAVAPERKDAARGAAVRALNEVDWRGKTLIVRINGLDSHHCHMDVQVLARHCLGLHLLLVPMVNQAADLQFVATLLDQVERSAERKTPLGLEALIETPLGLEQAGSIAQATPRLAGMSFGAGDYAAAMGMPAGTIGAPDASYGMAVTDAEGQVAGFHPADKFHYATARLGNVCRAYGLRPIDSAYADFRDAEGFRAACRRALALGFEGKLCIHPSQVAIANEVFAPDAEAVAQARALVDAVNAATQAGQGAATHQGQMVDLANLRLARNVLARADAIAQRAQQGGRA